MTSQFRIRTLNAISPRGLECLPSERYDVGSSVEEPHAILVRSADMHHLELPSTLLAVGRAGAGTNNIPVETLSRRGAPVFNSPGANANAVKELVLAGLFLAARNICGAWDYVRGLDGDDHALEAAVEKGKKQFAGFEVAGRTLGVVGLGAIGVEVANAALGLGMRVVGYDPHVTVDRAWQLSGSVGKAQSLDDLLGRSDAVTLHLPLTDDTRGLIDASRLRVLRAGGIVLNFARGPIVDETAVLEALASGHLGSYVCDFPTRGLKGHPRVIALPHLGASTSEAEENCAVMVVETLREFLEHGQVRHSVNFPDASLPRTPGTARLVIANANVPNMVGQISSSLGRAGLNIADLLNKSRGELAYTIVDTDDAIGLETVAALQAIDGVLSARLV